MHPSQAAIVSIDNLKFFLGISKSILAWFPILTDKKKAEENHIFSCVRVLHIDFQYADLDRKLLVRRHAA